MVKKIFLIIGLTIVFSVFVSGQTKKILFLGNSYTTANNLPDMVSKLASSLDDSVYFDSNTPGGYRLLNHATNQTSLAKISQEDWDYVVLQAQSQEPSWSPAQLAQEVLPYAGILNDSIKSNNACTETVFYMTWGRKYGDQQNCATWPPVCTFLGMQERLMAGYMTMAEQNQSTVAPVGLAWKHSMDNDPDSLINLYSSDNSHPSLSGSYLTACVMYATMFQKSPVGSDYLASLPESDALFLQQIAEYVVLNENYNFTFFDTYSNINYDLGWQSWFDSGNVIFAGFSSFNTGPTYNFFDQSLNAETWLWDFDDGSISILQNPIYTYAQSGIYNITQTVSNTCFSSVESDTLNVIISSTQKVLLTEMITLSPNPGNGVFEIIIKSPGIFDTLYYEIFDLNGKLVSKGEIFWNGSEAKQQIDISANKKGLYKIRIHFNDQIINRTLVIQ